MVRGAGDREVITATLTLLTLVSGCAQVSPALHHLLPVLGRAGGGLEKEIFVSFIVFIAEHDL